MTSPEISAPVNQNFNTTGYRTLSHLHYKNTVGSLKAATLPNFRDGIEIVAGYLVYCNNVRLSKEITCASFGCVGMDNNSRGNQ